MAKDGHIVTPEKWCGVNNFIAENFLKAFDFLENIRPIRFIRPVNDCFISSQSKVTYL